jgi:hypothetical protein
MVQQTEKKRYKVLSFDILSGFNSLLNACKGTLPDMGARSEREFVNACFS